MKEQEKIDLESLTPFEVDKLSQEISIELAKIAEETCAKIDKLLGRYNMTSKINIELVNRAESK